MNYCLLALDLDGTALSSEKIVTDRTAAAIRRAIAAGKEVLFATGRAPSELREHLQRFPEMNYLLCLSGATVRDLRAGKNLNIVNIPLHIVEKIMEISKKVDAMVAIYAGEDVFVEKTYQGNMGWYGCACFEPLYDSCAIWVDSLDEAISLRGNDVRKINFYFHSTEDWRAAGEVLGKLPVAHASGIPNNYEISPQGVDKGVGLTALCETLGIPISQAIAVGDEGNDVAMIQAAGLGVAMGNATEEVKAVADAVTADCDHDGVAEVIEKYLLA